MLFLPILWRKETVSLGVQSKKDSQTGQHNCLVVQSVCKTVPLQTSMNKNNLVVLLFDHLTKSPDNNKNYLNVQDSFEKINAI